MAVHSVILDSRIHRTLRLSNDAEEFNIVSADSGYVVLLKNDGTNDHLSITKDGDLVANIVCSNTFTPPLSGTPIRAISNSGTQFSLELDDQVYRVIEVDQNLCPLDTAILYAQSYATADAPLTPNNSFVFKPSAGSLVAIPAVGVKVPPKLG